MRGSVPLRAVALVLLVALAGCTGWGGPLGGDDTLPGAGESTPGADGAVDGSAGSATGGGPPTAVDPRGSPWGERIVVAVESDTDPGRDFTPLVREAARYWTGNAERYAGYPVELAVAPDAERPDVIVEFVENIPACDGANDVAGCAPLVTDARQIDRPERIFVKGGLADESTVLVLKHELGHALGLGHDDEPASVMAKGAVLYTTPQPDAVDRDFPWDDTSFTVHVDAANASDPDAANEQIDHALAYFVRGAPGMPEGLSFERVADPNRAEIVVRFGDVSPCGDGPGSCVQTAGPDPDGDGAVESYRRATIVLVSIDTKAVGWHVGYWLSHALGTERDAEKPPPFRDASYGERRSEWWR